MSRGAVMQPAVSVIVPVYNGEKYVVAALDSIRAQTCADWQVILVDDGSTDGTAAVLAQYPGDPRIEIVRQENQGPAASRNRGQARCTAQYVAFLDADDMWLPTYLARMVQELTANPSAVAAFAGWQYVDQAGDPLPQVIIPSRALGRRLGEELLWRNALVTSGVVVRRWALEACRGFDTELTQAQDWDLWLRLLALGPFIAVPKRLVWYRTHGENRSDDLAVAEAYRLKVLRRHLHVEGDPAGWTELQRQAIGYTLFVSALAYFRRGKVAAGVAKTQEALQSWPAMAARDETYYELGCAYQQRGWRGSFADLRLDESTHLIHSLVFEHWPAPSETARHAWWAHACLVLSQLAYEAGDGPTARRLAAQAWRGAAIRQRGSALRAMLRAGLPSGLVRWVRSVRSRSTVVAE